MQTESNKPVTSCNISENIIKNKYKYKMLTPRFEITQGDADIVITIHAPYSNIKDTEIYVDGTDFLFYATPYYLRLKLPGKVSEDNGSYDCETGDFTLRFTKVNKGEYFKNLDMITTLLAPAKKKDVFIPNIEVIDNPSASSDITDSVSSDITDSVSSDNFDLKNEPQEKSAANTMFLINLPKYGFANKISGALNAFEEAWIKEIIDLPEPDVTPESKRTSLREDREVNDFNEDHYMADLMETESIEPSMTYTAEWDTLQKNEVTFNKKEIDLLKELPNKEYLLEFEDIRILCFNLVDILYASCYDHRTTLGENTVESSWTINKLSATLCWFQDFTSMDEVIRTSFRRSLCYPLFRNWELSMKVFEDVKKVVKLGRKYIIKRFCEIHHLFNHSYEPRYILNQLYIKDFLIWLQNCSESVITSLDSVLNEIEPKKENMGLELMEIEVAAYSVQEEALVIGNSLHKMTDQIAKLSINNPEERLRKSSSTDSSDTDTDSETDSESTSSSSLDSDDCNEENNTKQKN